ncbi:unnamed protein product [Parajaminaea phylloscopi]
MQQQGAPSIGFSSSTPVGATSQKDAPGAAAAAAAGGGPADTNAASFHNPYLGHRNLTASEAHLLGEYYRLSQTLKRIIAMSGTLSATKPHAQVLDSLRLTERKMGLVITLFKASVWSIMMEQGEKEKAREEARRLLEDEREQEAAWREQEEAARRGGYDDEPLDDVTLTYDQR